MCDVRFASAAASFTSVFTKRGLVAEHGISWTVPRLIGVGRALDLLWTSRRIDATEAERIGLVEYLVEPVDLVAAATATWPSSPPPCHPRRSQTRSAWSTNTSDSLPAALPDADATAWAAIDRPDAREGASALLEKRPAKFPRIGKA